MREYSYLYSVEVIIERIDDNEDITELSGQDTTPVVPPVFSPDNVYLIISQVPGLLKHALLTGAGHSCTNVEHHLMLNVNYSVIINKSFNPCQCTNCRQTLYL